MTMLLPEALQRPRATTTQGGNTERPPRQPRRRLLRAAGYLLAFALPPLLAGAGWSISAALATPPPPPPLHGPAPAPPTHDPGKLTAVVVAGATGAESVDLLVPYQMLAESGRFNVYTVAPQRRPLPLFPASPQLQGVDFLPHLSLQDYNRRIGTDPDIIVVPWIPAGDGNAPLIAWLRDHMTNDTTALLTICGGSWTAAEAGLLDGRAATTHQNVLPLVQRDHPSVDWIDGRRWVHDGDVVSSAGITAAFDATLRVLEHHADRQTAEDVADRLGYPHLGFLDDPTFTVPTADTTVRTLNLAYRWETNHTGVALYDGVGEIELASIIDLYPRTHTTVLHPVGVDGDVITTRHGVHLLPRHRLSDVPAVDRMLVPGAPPEPVAAQLTRWAGHSGADAHRVHDNATGRFPVDAVIHDIARQDTRASATLVAKGIEYPITSTDLGGPAWPYDLLLRPLALGLLGLAAAAGLGRWRNPRKEQA